MATRKKPIEAEPTPSTPPAPTETKIAATNRLNREGRYQPFIERREVLRLDLREKGVRKAQATVDSWNLALTEFPPQTPGAATVAPLPREQGASAAPELTASVAPWSPPAPPDVAHQFEALPPTRYDSVRDDYLWVFNHPAMWRPSQGPDGEIFLQTSDIDGCPSRGAWGLLAQAVKDPKKFQEKFSDKFLRASNHSRGGSFDDEQDGEVVADPGLDDLKAMIDRFKEDMLTDLAKKIDQSVSGAAQHALRDALTEWQRKHGELEPQALRELQLRVCDVLADMFEATSSRAA